MSVLFNLRFQQGAATKVVAQACGVFTVGNDQANIHGYTLSFLRYWALCFAK